MKKTLKKLKPEKNNYKQSAFAPLATIPHVRSFITDHLVQFLLWGIYAVFDLFLLVSSVMYLVVAEPADDLRVAWVLWAFLRQLELCSSSQERRESLSWQSL